MSKFIVSKSVPLSGSVKISGAKNAVLPILAACILTECECELLSVPPLSDVYNMISILSSFGAEVNFDEKNEKINICTKNIEKTDEDYSLGVKLRASFLVAGSLLARFKRAKVPLPGGCQIGTRPVDLHLKGFTALGAKIKQEHGYIEMKCKKLKGAKIYLDFPSVGATENIMMAAVLAEGVTSIENAAAEPEISDLAEFLNCMGANIKGAGTDTIEIHGVEQLKGVRYCIMPDRIEAGTFMAAAAVTKGDIVLENVIPDHLNPMIAKLQEANIKCVPNAKSLRVYYDGEINGFSLKTMPFPGFPTDLQAPFMSVMALAKGTSMVTETVFENRFTHAGELKRMGANIKIDGRSAVIEGVKKLMGTQVRATDLRAGAALIISALSAEGKTEISDIYHIERGYCSIEEKFKILGAVIKKVEE